MIRRFYRWFLARFRLNLQVVCEESAALGPNEDYHDYDDSEDKQPWHWHEMTCERCGKHFFI